MSLNMTIFSNEVYKFDQLELHVHGHSGNDYGQVDNLLVRSFIPHFRP